MKKNSSKDNIVGIHAVRILLKVRPFDVYEIYLSDKSSSKFDAISNEAKKIISLFKKCLMIKYMKFQMLKVTKVY